MGTICYGPHVLGPYIIFVYLGLRVQGLERRVSGWDQEISPPSGRPMNGSRISGVVLNL